MINLVRFIAINDIIENLNLNINDQEKNSLINILEIIEKVKFNPLIFRTEEMFIIKVKSILTIPLLEAGIYKKIRCNYTDLLAQIYNNLNYHLIYEDYSKGGDK